MKSKREEKIEEYERLGLFDRDIEDDPPTRELKPEEIEYPKKGFLQGLKTRFAYLLAYRYAAKMERQGLLVIKEVRGAENLGEVGGCVLTANHFSPLDSFIMTRAFDLSGRRGRMYRVIKEGNYTSFPGFYGFLMRNCNTLPLSQSRATMLKFLRGTSKLLKDGECVLVYPEQSMWHNYRKPKHLKPGAFEIAARAGVPVVPTFITMEDTDRILDDGERVQAHTVHIGAPIYPIPELSVKENAEKMRDEVYRYNVSVYESFYGLSLEYLTDSNSEG